MWRIIFQLIDWPANSPNLNAIENLWHLVKTNVGKRMLKNCEESVWFYGRRMDGIVEC
jgi:hypothetical protein